MKETNFTKCETKRIKKFLKIMSKYNINLSVDFSNKEIEYYIAKVEDEIRHLDTLCYTFYEFSRKAHNVNEIIASNKNGNICFNQLKNYVRYLQPDLVEKIVETSGTFKILKKAVSECKQEIVLVSPKKIKVSSKILKKTKEKTKD